MTGKMFPFITETWNPLAGGPCPGECSYCWATDLKARYKYSKYDGPWRVDEKVIGKTFKPGAFVFVQDMSDLWAPTVPFSIQQRVLANIMENPQTTFLTLTKFPEGYEAYEDGIPDNVVLGITMETNRGTSNFSKAPQPYDRLVSLDIAAKANDLRTFISIEPIMDFDRDHLLPWINLVHPWAIAIGYDNYNNGLPEPPLAKTKELIESLHKRGITVYEKTLREAHLTVGMEDRGEKT
jgi:DNA repair photolyase